MRSAARSGFNWAVFGLTFVLLACAGAGYVLSQPKLYRSSARLAFETDVRAALAMARVRKGGAIDPIACYRASSYRALKAETRKFDPYLHGGIV